MATEFKQEILNFSWSTLWFRTISALGGVYKPVERPYVILRRQSDLAPVNVVYGPLDDRPGRDKA